MNGIRVEVERTADEAQVRLWSIDAVVERELRVPGHQSWLDLYEQAAAVFGLPVPHARRAPSPRPAAAALRPLLTDAVDPRILYGYGDPAVLWDEGRWRLAVTSNDAPDIFPLLSSRDLQSWRLDGFAFEEPPPWALTGAGSDFWAPELHRVGDEVWLLFAARKKPDGELAIGLARAPSAIGPFVPDPEPLVEGGVIDPHLVVDDQGRAHLIWKEDRNDRWPPLVARLLLGGGEEGRRLFPTSTGREGARVAAELWRALQPLGPMETFFALQPLIEAATEDFPGFRARLATVDHPLAREALSACATRILGQPLTTDGGLTGEPRLVLENDQAWEAHLIEGVWITRREGRWWALYAGNDFSTERYGIGVAVADHPLGPYAKAPEPLLTSSADRTGPGHPSVASGADGVPRLFLHAFQPGRTGYKAFRALLTAELEVRNGWLAVKAQRPS